MLIDMHAHVIPRDFPSAGSRAGAERWPGMEPSDSPGARVLVSGEMRFVAQDAYFDAERRLSAMDENGVDVEVVSPMPPLLNYRLSPRDALDLCACINEFTARLCEVEPSRFLGLGTVPLQDPELAARELAEVKAIGQLLVGTDFPAMAREQPAARTLRSMGLPSDVLEDITWNNCFRFLGVPPPQRRQDEEGHMVNTAR